VLPTSEEAFRALLDGRGVLRPDALEAPERGASYAVFAQRTDARLDIAAIKQQGSRFFDARLGLTVDKEYGDAAPAVDAARVVVASADGVITGTRLVYGRPVEQADLEVADAAERLQGTSGLALLARRCKTVWLVVPNDGADRPALLIATVLASVVLGPIVEPGAGAIFGVRTAREKLERLGRS